ncbi:hypothetical protein [Micromonospora sp. WMMD1082]|uniref:hypothetical protein n=1 Tax=Micromonospora sp. WMMD1082 TaxID=3016104 RepID=UPI0024162821|nr:hypothetical protein [Micromonospora sp. WMMD1082]MDG4798150.1 hypothetical protein [Micromonospora sp. WMMD1082]
MPNELENLIFATLDRIVGRVLGSRPTTIDGEQLDETVYSHLKQGILIDPVTYRDPWVPGGTTVDLTAPGAVPEMNRSRYAAWRTAELTNDMLMVTTDGSYRPYRSGRHLDAQYEAILTQMQPAPPPPVNPEVRQRVDEATRLLHVLDEQGDIVDDTPLYRRYQDKAQAYAEARAEFAEEQLRAQADPARLAIWPQLSIPLKAKVDRAYDAWKTSGAAKVEAALATIKAEGRPITEAMVASARNEFDKWSLVLSGVELITPYTYVEPAGWCDPTRTDIGWTRLKISSAEANGHVASGSSSFARSYSTSHSSSTSVGGQVGYAFLFVGGDYGTAESESTWGSTASKDSSYEFRNDGSDFSLELEWALCRVQRRWLRTDLFAMQNWYLPGQKKHCISDGTIASQSLNERPMMPMIPMDFLVIRNVRIHSKKWGSDGRVLSSMYDSSKGDYRASSTSYGGGGGVSLGFITFGGRVSHARSDASAQYEAEHRSTDSSDWGWRFEDGTLEIRGAQIVGWVSSMTPPCPPMDDPTLAADR